MKINHKKLINDYRNWWSKASIEEQGRLNTFIVLYLQQSHGILTTGESNAPQAALDVPAALASLTEKDTAGLWSYYNFLYNENLRSNS